MRLAQANEVWGAARFATDASRHAIAQFGIRPHAIDLAASDLNDLPSDFDYVLHFAWMRAPLRQLDEAIKVNVEGAGLVLQHCRNAKAALVVSSTGIYTGNPDPWHVYTESDPIGNGTTAYTATSPTCKVGLEAVARFCARMFNLPVTIARLNTVCGLDGTYFEIMAKFAVQGRPIPFTVVSDPNPHSPIHTLDMQDQVEALLGSAGVPALITNWCGDEVISTQAVVADIAALSGHPASIDVRPHLGAAAGNIGDSNTRRSITGPCKIAFEPAFAALFREHETVWTRDGVLAGG
ncbi:nucleoside-diphosphate-sugar epimerase [Novosphingobium hassiacum]|uniref:Nucleoside-diphosphate-sugar epimerase n=2 Tax=Novosphingobium hassiacum TaxID=173676 RepID=A0A7W6EWF0_9SPHN|nr:nucleoside-diphosphate-sugar epimerase [Novosphingobium hassiacum]